MPQNLDAENLADFVKSEYGVEIEERYYRRLAIDCKGCAKCFFTRLQGRVCDERFGENACLYPSWPKDLKEKAEKIIKE